MKEEKHTENGTNGKAKRIYMSEQQQPGPLGGRSFASSAAAFRGLHSRCTAVTPSVGSPGALPPTANE